MKTLSRNSLRFAASVAALILLTGCDWARWGTSAALHDYEIAVASGDAPAARAALIKVIKTSDADRGYWLELGKLELRLADYGAAYYAFTRAHELDRTNVETLGAVTQLALYSGNLDEAEAKARLLELLAPSHPAITLVRGYSALRRGDLETADRLANQLLEVGPYDTGAKLLKVRVLIAQDEHQRAISLLDEQVRVKPDDIGALKALIALHKHHEDWGRAAVAARLLVQASPGNREAGLLFIEAAFKAGQAEVARSVSLQLLAGAEPELVDSVLTTWASHGRDEAAAKDAWRLARQSPSDQQLPYASYFNRIGYLGAASTLLGSKPRLPVTSANSSVNAIFAETLHLRGQNEEAIHLLNSILTLEPDHVYALRTRVKVRLKQGGARYAIKDLQRLVTLLPDSAEDRLKLAQAYQAAGDRRQHDRALWNAFHEIPADRQLYEALRAHIAASSPREVVYDVEKEFQQQLDIALVRNLVS